MYNRYIPAENGYARIQEDEYAPSFDPIQANSGPQAPPHPEEDTADAGRSKKTGGLAALLKSLKLDNLDTGDVLLLLIILFLFLEGDDMELIITLGLMLLLGLE